jgi:hypothetical protein
VPNEPKTISFRTLGEVSKIDPSTARLPETYANAKKALAECERIDECRSWADKMAALASYARQADDDELYKVARRIQGRAVKRCGELLKEFDARGGDRSKSTGAGTFAPEAKQNGNGMAAGAISQRAAAEAAGMSKRQQVTAVRVANVPAEAFEAAIESDNPPTVTELAKAGTAAREALGFDYLQGRDPRQFNAAIHTMGAMRALAEKLAQHPPAFIAGGIDASEIHEAQKLAADIDAWIVGFFHKLGVDGS